ncbi:MAG: DUF1269 domain-containing protein [Chloroflexi bacterium]|nr:MAG: DUF1269 domain-containing protein [Chloroflexota bacterium]
MYEGPIDFIALEFKTEQLKGEILPELLELVNNKTVRVIDLVVIQKHDDGSHKAIEMQQLAPELLSIFNPLNVEVSGIAQVEDIEMVAEEMKTNTTAAILLFENLWPIKFRDAVKRAKGRMIAQVRIPEETVQEVLAAFASAEGQ